MAHALPSCRNGGRQRHRHPLRLSTTISPSGPAVDRFARLTLPFDRGAYLTREHRKALDAAFARHPAAVLLTIDHPSSEIFTYNVDQDTPEWPCPVVLVAPKDSRLVRAAEATGRILTLEIDGCYRRQVAGRNVVGRLDRGKGRFLVLSTPVTSWFTSTCERGPGIAGFLAMARLAKSRFLGADIMFVATSGHEIGHGGMQHFLSRLAPQPDAVLAWAHFGATLAARDMLVRLIARSPPLEWLIDRHFAGIERHTSRRKGRCGGGASRHSGGGLPGLLRYGGRPSLLPYAGGLLGRN